MGDGLDDEAVADEAMGSGWADAEGVGCGAWKDERRSAVG